MFVPVVVYTFGRSVWLDCLVKLTYKSYDNLIFTPFLRQYTLLEINSDRIEELYWEEKAKS